MLTIALLGGYIITSYFLFKYPQLFHKKKQFKIKCQHISHRGGAGENIENTISAFKWAVQQGTDMLEIDLQMTRDKKVVVFHDNNLFRTAGINKNISELNYNDLPSLKCSIPIDFDEDNVCIGGADTCIPLLEDVFLQFPNTAINIDVKNDNDDLIKEVNKLIKKYNREKNCVWGNVSSKVTNKCFFENPEIPLLFSAQRVVFLLVLTYTGLLPFFPIKESCLELMMPSVAWRNMKLKAAIYHHLSYRILLWLMDRLLLRKSLFEHLKKRGIQTYLWVLNTEADFEKAYKLGATGVMTDYPSKLRNFLDLHPEFKK